jgi:endogenous inhibitor of DNA gyrase (YacG/DUF329 family)
MNYYRCYICQQGAQDLGEIKHLPNCSSQIVCPTCKLPNDWRSALVVHGVAFLCTDKFHLAKD